MSRRDLVGTTEAVNCFDVKQRSSLADGALHRMRQVGTDLRGSFDSRQLVVEEVAGLSEQLTILALLFVQHILCVGERFTFHLTTVQQTA